ncbi:glycosyltransferase family 4 protein [Sphingomonas sp. NFR15]|uniref:glycosyltransferase family 4 protein n=1 Tax=Sphingomonas sp. NFR15 TaxID=1566282 RepID=UPI0008860A79|nr:glycosyltransferase family 4 protein [Sphingomonas sp. NFR15]SDA36962.1 Glycosyltransferase involved in cell wall bisynthesis [Sphingomonas sp. NFR15]
MTKPMTKLRPKFIIAIGSLGDYRLGVVKELRKRLGKDLGILAGSPAYDATIRLLDYEAHGVERLSNTYVGRDILFQRLPLLTLLRAEGLVMDLNPRVPHVWLIVLVRRLIGRRTALWGHAWPRQGQGSRSDYLRGLLRSLATGLVTYTETQADELRRLYPSKRINAAPNALQNVAQMHFEHGAQRFRILYVGRLVVDKKPMILLDAFLRIAAEVPSLTLTIIGDGPERAGIAERASGSPFSDRIEMPGHVSDYERLRAYYAESIVSVSPGYIGLSVTQSFSFGVPMLVSKSERHSPEIEAVRAGFNGEFFETDNVASLSKGLLSFTRNSATWAGRGDAIVADCAERYSVERMAAGLINALQEAQ